MTRGLLWHRCSSVRGKKKERTSGTRRKTDDVLGVSARETGDVVVTYEKDGRNSACERDRRCCLRVEEKGEPEAVASGETGFLSVLDGARGKRKV